MAKRFVSKKTSYLYEADTGSARKMVLIYGDEVNAQPPAVNGRMKAEFRGQKGYIKEEHLGNAPSLEIYFIDVGQGDSTFIVTPNRKKILIDGGINKRAFGFLAWKYRFDKDGPPIDIDLLVLSHADGDHIDGLVPIIQHPRINVRKIVHNGIATFNEGAFDTALGNLDSNKDYLTTRHDEIGELNGLDISESFGAWHRAVTAESTQYNAVDSTTGQIDVGDPDISIDILGPRLDMHRGKPAYRWLGGEAQTINGHSVVLRLTNAGVSMLFSGDLNSKGSDILLEDPVISSKLSAHVFKAPHHGSHDFQLAFLNAIRPQISIISSGDDPDHGHPRAVFIGAAGRASRSNEPLIFSTEIAATFVETGAKENKTETGIEDVNVRSPEINSIARTLFKRRLHGMINVRTDGKDIYAARRVATGYWWESYGPIKAEP